MLLLLLGCADDSLIDSVGEPDFPAQSVQWRQAELRCTGSQVGIRAWTTGPGSTASLYAVGTLEDGSESEATEALSLDSQDTTSGVQAWTYSGYLELLPCAQVSAWQLTLRDARGDELHCMNQEQSPC